MLRNFGMTLLLLGMVTLSVEGKVAEKYATNKRCEACHTRISKQWESSRHAHSNFTKNELYDKTLDYMVLKDMSRTKEEIVVQCSKCHNPRIEKRKLDEADKLGLLLDIDREKIDRILTNDNMRNGINCVVCHNVSEIHFDPKQMKRGFDAVTFGPQGVMYGPFKGAKSPYHRTEYREFFAKDPNRLCFVCHYGDRNSHGLQVYATGSEYQAAPGEKPQCVSCHMSGKKKDVASNYRMGGKAKIREVRDHLFASFANSKIYRKYLEMEGKLKGDQLTITLRNKTPHKIPTGYGLRRLELQVEAYDKNDKLLAKKSESFGATWVDEKGEKTVPHLAVRQTEDTRIAPRSTYRFTMKLPPGTALVNYRLVTHQVDPELAKKLGLKDEFFTKEGVLYNKLLER